ncbi:MAG: hypothetical protein FJ134_11910 [Deltaproteobacteria bacterium]|nr:hypothetical protein [Deltaproteobacteria bacterium]
MPRFFRDRTLPARCPFCRGEISPPAPVEGGLWYEFDGGFCRCGAVYALDPTARNGGAVLLQAMLMACGGDMDKVLSLSPDTDYDEGHVHRYDGLNHRLEPQAFGTLYFIRLREESGSGHSDM